MNADGSMYEGEWEDGKRHDRGVEMNADGSICEGEWEDGSWLGGGEMP
jgi:hypothetical protein